MLKSNIPLGITVVAYPKKEAMTCMNAKDVIAPANTVNRGFFIALKYKIIKSFLSIVFITFFSEGSGDSCNLLCNAYNPHVIVV